MKDSLDSKDNVITFWPRWGSFGWVRTPGVCLPPLPPPPPQDEASFIFVFKICSPHQSGKSFLSGVQSAPAAIGKNVPNVIFHLKVHVYFVDLFAII